MRSLRENKYDEIYTDPSTEETDEEELEQEEEQTKELRKSNLTSKKRFDASKVNFNSRLDSFDLNGSHIGDEEEYFDEK